MEHPTIPRYWIFQGRSDVYDLEQGLIPGETEPWTLNRSRTQVHPGDVVYFWRAGRQASLMGWGTVTGEPHQEDLVTKSSKGGGWRVDVTYETRFEKPIPREALADAGLNTLNLLRSSTGTNFKVTAMEAMQLGEFVEKHHEHSPRPPFDTEDSTLPISVLDSLSIGTTVKRVLQRAANLTDPIQTPTLFDALIALLAEHEQDGTARFLVDYFETLVKSSSPIAPNENWDTAFISVETLIVLEAARSRAISTTNSERIGLRHFVAGLLQAADPHTTKYLDDHCNQAGRSLQHFVEAFVQYTAENFPKDHASVWLTNFRDGVGQRLQGFGLAESTPITSQQDATHGLTKQAGIPASSETIIQSESQTTQDTSQPSATQRYAALNRSLQGYIITDRPFGGDHLRINAEVAVLAHTFARVNPDPGDDDHQATIALGLFGRWGSGKSFFMRRLQEKIVSLSDTKTTNSAAGLYCQHIEQIEFNAWHYKEADLWASLVHHIFDSLQKRFAAKDQADNFRRLIERLDMSKEQRDEIQAERQKLQEEMASISAGIARQQLAIDGKVAAELNKISTLPGRMLKNAEARKNLLELIPQVAQVLGVPEKTVHSTLADTDASADKLLDTIHRLGADANQANQASRSILHATVAWPTLIVLALGIIAYALPILLIDKAFWDNIMNAATQAVSVFAAPLALILSRLKKSSNILHQVNGIQKSLQEDIRLEEEQKNATLTTLRVDLQRIEKQIERDSAREVQIEKDINDTARRLAELGSPRSLVDFINERAKSSDYRSRLGILALIRRDFQTLSDIMTQPKQVAGEGPPVHIDRIILYIDDLDRVNKSDKVLKVMEAVHLLLSLPLFNVVVAVDEWWATQSVASNYSEYFNLIAPTSSGPSAGSDDADTKPDRPSDQAARKATPREFLEKVFQFCLWVKPLGQELTESLIDGTVRMGANNVEDETVSIPGETGQSVTQPALTDTLSPTASETANKTGDAAASSTLAIVMGGQPNQSKNSQGEQTGEIVSDNDFAVGPDERATMKTLAQIVGRSPRTVKRFINTYRILKAILIHRLTADGGEDANRETIEMELLDQHPQIMFLLAIQIGQPEVAKDIFELLDEEMAMDDSQDVRTTLLTAQLQVPNTTSKLNWEASLEVLSDVLSKRRDVLHITSLALLDRWLGDTARFGFEEWEPRSERLWRQ